MSVQVEARFLVPGWTIVVSEGRGRHRRSGAGLPTTFFIEKVTYDSRHDWIRLTGRQGNSPAAMDLRPTQKVTVQH